MGPICVTTYVSSKAQLKSLPSSKPRHPGLGVGGMDTVVVVVAVAVVFIVVVGGGGLLVVVVA